MKARNRIYKWLIALWLLMSCQPALCAFQSATPPAAWRTTPTLSMDREMAYQFRSTSAYTLTTNTSVYAPGTSSPYGNTVKRARKGDIDDEEDPEGDPQGYIDTAESNRVSKILKEGHVYIIRDGHIYTMLGQKVR